MKTTEVLSELKRRFPNEPEYHQAVEEVLSTIEDVYNEINARRFPESFIQHCRYVGLLDNYRQCNFPIATFCQGLRSTSPYAMPMARSSLLHLFNSRVLQNYPESARAASRW